MGDRRADDRADLLGEIPAICRAGPAAASAMSTTDSSSRAQRRVTMPERSRIHWSEESIQVQTSSLVITRSGRYPPTPLMRA
ncbi:hypothetical protein [Barrientosiimonas endolithica]|uniref:hypothetical protein n=1 Tax=Barrientosiimonas endolithica TaxID=1535208 RepID=UPI003D9AE14A